MSGNANPFWLERWIRLFKYLLTKTYRSISLSLRSLDLSKKEKKRLGQTYVRSSRKWSRLMTKYSEERISGKTTGKAATELRRRVFFPFLNASS